jgi:hypothetical protein
MRRLRPAAVALVAAMLVGATGATAYADVDKNGNFTEGLGGSTYWKGWVNDGFAGRLNVSRADDSSWFEASWEAPNYGVLPRIGKSIEMDAGWGVPVDETADSLPADFSLSFDRGDPNKDGDVWIGIYGWIDDGKAGWPYSTEYYVVQNWGGKPPRVESGFESKGGYTADGVDYDVYYGKHPLGHHQWVSVRKEPATSGTVDVKKHFDAWRSRGMENGTVAEMVWSVEGMAGTDGTVRYDTWSVPDLRKNGSDDGKQEGKKPEDDTKSDDGKTSEEDTKSENTKSKDAPARGDGLVAGWMVPKDEWAWWLSG